MAATFDGSEVPPFALNYEMDWGPLFKLTDIERMEGIRTITTAVGNAVGSYLLTPDEARDLLEMAWAEMDVEYDLPETDEAFLDLLDRINLVEGSKTPRAQEAETEPEGQQNWQSPSQNREGGNEVGENTDPSQPARG
jgi:hypothetical protein